MRRTYKPLFWRATRPVNSTDCMIERRYCLKRVIIDIFILYFKKYFHSFLQSAVFTERVARQNNGSHVLRMIVKLAYCKQSIQELIFALLSSVLDESIMQLRRIELFTDILRFIYSAQFALNELEFRICR